MGRTIIRAHYLDYRHTRTTIPETPHSRPERYVGFDSCGRVIPPSLPHVRLYKYFQFFFFPVWTMRIVYDRTVKLNQRLLFWLKVKWRWQDKNHDFFFLSCPHLTSCRDAVLLGCAMSRELNRGVPITQTWARTHKCPGRVVEQQQKKSSFLVLFYLFIFLFFFYILISIYLSLFHSIFFPSSLLLLPSEKTSSIFFTPLLLSIHCLVCPCPPIKKYTHTQKNQILGWYKIRDATRR